MRRRFLGFLAIFWGVFFLLPMLVGGMRARSHAHFVEAAQVDGTTSAETSAAPAYHHAHHYHYGPFSFFGGIFKLLFLGFLFTVLFKGFRRRRHHWKHHHRRGEKSPDDLTEDIRVGDEVNRAAAQASDMPSPDEMTVDDLVLAMKRLGIKKLEL